MPPDPFRLAAVSEGRAGPGSRHQRGIQGLGNKMHGPGAAAVDPRPGVRDPPRVPLGAVGAHARGRGHRAGRRSGGDGGRGMSGARGGGRVAPPLGERAAAAAAAAAGGGGEEAAPVSALEVVSFLGKLLCAVAALKAALYLLRRVCLAMAWKSGGASHSELIHNLRSESRGGGAGGRGSWAAGRPLPAAR